ncbi:CYTH domain-containing protein [Leucobacter sp. CSA1]|uniref:CYTH domain-containing protein n=1 Tax=Leucobacter chromiisoli TaxID=2796471 RepID=A0A934UU29_9MICO|nr:CYTH domain-containing protein [Leucobacter chromiisoli]MBK0417753.1 CYTH domain-containing protein [Leucobacter chromiisoli]
MSDRGATATFEVERKYEAPGDAALPGAEAFERLGMRASEPETFELAADYLDTAEGDLGRARLAVRSRHGGKDAGWHLKERGAEGVAELQWPPADEMPEGLRAELRDRVGDAVDRIGPLASLRTVRTAVVLSDESGVESVEIADDVVLATDHLCGVRRAWREWEAELLPGADAAVLDRLEPLLLAAGARPSLSSAKIARASGRLIDLALARGAGAAELAALGVMDLADRLAAREEPVARSRAAELRVLDRLSA